MTTDRYPTDRRYSPDHVWVAEDGRWGITARLAGWLPAVTRVHLPEVGATLSPAEAFAALEVDKGTFDLFAPARGRVVARNEAVLLDAEACRRAPHEAGWLVRVDGPRPRLLSARAYERSTTKRPVAR